MKILKALMFSMPPAILILTASNIDKPWMGFLPWLVTVLVMSLVGMASWWIYVGKGGEKRDTEPD